MACDCIDTMNRKLQTDVLRPGAISIAFDDDGPRAVIRTEGRTLLGADTPPYVVAEFCPFCGTAYETGVKADKAAA